MIGLQSVSNTTESEEDTGSAEDTESEEDADSSPDRDSKQAGSSKEVEPTIATHRVRKYPINHLAPLTTSPTWDKVVIDTGLNIPSRGLDALRSILNEAPFVRSRLPKTSLALRLKSKQVASAGFCITQITDGSTPEDLRVAFSELLPDSLALAQESPKLSIQLRNLLSHTDGLYDRLPLRTQRAITDCLVSSSPTTQTQKRSTAFRSQSSQNTAPKASTPSRPSAAAQTQATPRTPEARTTTQGPSTTSALRSSTSRTQPTPRASQKAPATKGPPARPFLSPALKSSTPSKPKPPTTPTSAFQKETTASELSGASALKASTPSRTRPPPRTSQRSPAAPDTSSACVTQPSPSSAPKSSTPSEPRLPTTISQKAATAPGPSGAPAHKTSTPSRIRPPPSTSQRTPTTQDASTMSVTQIPLGSAPRSSTPSEPQASPSAVQDASTGGAAQVSITAPESALGNTPNTARDPKRRKRRKK